MISRLTFQAVIFAIIGTASLAFVASAQQPVGAAAQASAKPVRIVQLEHVVVIGKRSPQAPV